MHGVRLHASREVDMKIEWPTALVVAVTVCALTVAAVKHVDAAVIAAVGAAGVAIAGAMRALASKKDGE